MTTGGERRGFRCAKRGQLDRTLIILIIMALLVVVLLLIIVPFIERILGS